MICERRRKEVESHHELKLSILGKVIRGSGPYTAPIPLPEEGKRQRHMPAKPAPFKLLLLLLFLPEDMFIELRGELRNSFQNLHILFNVTGLEFAIIYVPKPTT